MASLPAIREGIRDRLNTISGLRCYAVMPPKPEPPAAAVAVRSAEMDLDMDGNCKYSFEIWLYVNPGDLTRAQSALDEYLDTTGEKSIRNAIAGDPSLGGVADWAKVTGWNEGPRLVDSAGTQLLAMPITCEVMA